MLIIFLLYFSFFLLFDYYPDVEVSTTVIKTPIAGTGHFMYMTITELIIIILVCIFHSGEVEQVNFVITDYQKGIFLLLIKLFKFIQTETCDGKITTKIKKFFTSDPWNMFDVLLFGTFYLAMVIRLLPMYGKILYVGHENCYEIGRWAQSYSKVLFN